MTIWTIQPKDPFSKSQTFSFGLSSQAVGGATTTAAQNSNTKPFSFSSLHKSGEQQKSASSTGSTVKFDFGSKENVTAKSMFEPFSAMMPSPSKNNNVSPSKGTTGNIFGTQTMAPATSLFGTPSNEAPSFTSLASKGSTFTTKCFGGK